MHCDLVLVMSVDPGFGGQSFIETSLDKLRAARAFLPDDVALEVDGGIDAVQRRRDRRGRRERARRRSGVFDGHGAATPRSASWPRRLGRGLTADRPLEAPASLPRILGPRRTGVFRAGWKSPPAVRAREPRERLTRWNSWADGQSPDGRRPPDATASSALELRAPGSLCIKEGRRQVNEDRRQDDPMDEAFALAERGRGATHPNPLVGALVVKDGAVVGRGFHAGPGEPHAEVVALREAGPTAAGATLYVTLEPCCHHGRTPPCSDAIVAAGVGRVVFALQDPNPLVDGRGAALPRRCRRHRRRRRRALGASRPEAERPFVKAATTGLPRVTLKAAVTLDGKVAAAGGEARWISGPESRRRVHAMRAVADAVMVGAGTARRDDPLLTVREVDGARSRARRRLARR